MRNIQDAFRALADPTRREILMHLSDRDMTIGEITNQFDMTRAAIKKHLTILEAGKLISVHRNGRERINKLEAAGLKSVADWLNYFDQFWDRRIDKLRHAIKTHQRDNNG